jgi:two-component system chemotaxis response regulator CheY
MGNHSINKGLRVLIIDDEWFQRTTLRQILHNLGLSTVFEAGSAADGMKETLRVHPNVVFCDIHMEHEDGFAYLTKLRTSSVPGVADLPVVMLTSERSIDAVSAAKELKVTGYLVKPVSTQTVKAAVERVLKFKI